MVGLVPKTVATQHLEDIEVEQTILFTLLLEWERPKFGCTLSLDKLISFVPNNDLVLRGRDDQFTLPCSYHTYDPNWKIRTTPKPTGKGALDAPEVVLVNSSGSQSSSSGSAC